MVCKNPGVWKHTADSDTVTTGCHPTSPAGQGYTTVQSTYFTSLTLNGPRKVQNHLQHVVKVTANFFSFGHGSPSHLDLRYMSFRSVTFHFISCLYIWGFLFLN